MPRADSILGLSLRDEDSHEATRQSRPWPYVDVVDVVYAVDFCLFLEGEGGGDGRRVQADDTAFELLAELQYRKFILVTALVTEVSFRWSISTRIA